MSRIAQIIQPPPIPVEPEYFPPEFPYQAVFILRIILIAIILFSLCMYLRGKSQKKWLIVSLLVLALLTTSFYWEYLVKGQIDVFMIFKY